MIENIYRLLVGWGMEFDSAVTMSRWLSFILALVLALVGYIIAKWVVLPALLFSINRSSTRADDLLLEYKPFQRLTLLVPLGILYGLTPAVLDGYANITRIAQGGILILMILVGTMVVNALLDGAQAIYDERHIDSELPLRSFMQVMRIILFFIAGILVIAVLINETPGALLAGLGAISAVLLLVFQDSLLGLVAGIQLTGNQLVSRGDLIEVPKYDASGEVLDIALTTVKVRNADQSITTVPTYSLISESFKNWRGLQETQARRILRAVLIDMTSVRFATAEMLAQQTQTAEIANTLEEICGEKTPTNLTLYRAYMTHYLRTHPCIYDDRTIVVRQQPPTPNGLPVELFCYTSQLDFVAYEQLQADVVEHALAMIPVFDLRVFQSPAGSDVRPQA